MKLRPVVPTCVFAVTIAVLSTPALAGWTPEGVTVKATTAPIPPPAFSVGSRECLGETGVRTPYRPVAGDGLMLRSPRYRVFNSPNVVLLTLVGRPGSDPTSTHAPPIE